MSGAYTDTDTGLLLLSVGPCRHRFPKRRHPANL